MSKRLLILVTLTVLSFECKSANYLCFTYEDPDGAIYFDRNSLEQAERNSEGQCELMGTEEKEEEIEEEPEINTIQEPDKEDNEENEDE